MNMDYLFSPTLLSIAAIAGIFCLAVVVLDIRRASHAKHLKRLMQSFVTSHGMQSFSVIAKLTDSADELFRLIEHLTTHDYVDIQLLVLVKDSANSSAVAELKRFQRKKHTTIRVSIARQRNGVNERGLITRYAKHDVLVWMQPSQRFSSNFFKYVSLELLDESRTAVEPRFVPRVNETLRSATAALNSVAEQTLRVALARTPTSAAIIRKAAYKRESVYNVAVTEHASVIGEPVRRASGRLACVALAIISLVGLISAFLLPTGALLVTAVVFGVIVLLVALRLLAYPYKPATMLSVVLLLPFWPAVEGIPYALTQIIRVLHGVMQIRQRLQRSNT